MRARSTKGNSRSTGLAGLEVFITRLSLWHWRRSIAAGNPEGAPARSLPTQLQPPMQQTLHLRFVSHGVLMTNSFTRHVAGQFMQVQRQHQTLLTGHAPVMQDLFA